MAQRPAVQVRLQQRFARRLAMQLIIATATGLLPMRTPVMAARVYALVVTPVLLVRTASYRDYISLCGTNSKLDARRCKQRTSFACEI